MSIRERKNKREAMRRWREMHPIMDAWNNHRFNARKRGISVEWTVEEFAQFCRETGYHLLRKDGYQIHRDGDNGPYAFRRVSMVKAEVNRWAQDFYRQSARLRANYLSRPIPAG